MTLVIAHRGASAYEPENSLAAFRRAVDLGADGVELDVHETADGRLVVVHDAELQGRPIRDLPLDQVRCHRLPNGEPVPTLDEALTVLGEAMLAFVEVKALSATGDATLFGIIDASPAPRRCRIHSFDHRIVRRLGTARRDVPVGALSASYVIDPVAQVRAAGAQALWQQQDLVDAALVDALHDAGREVYAWTVDEPARIRWLSGCGVDGVCTNRPDVAREVLG